MKANNLGESRHTVQGIFRVENTNTNFTSTDIIANAARSARPSDEKAREERG